MAYLKCLVSSINWYKIIPTTNLINCVI